MSVSCMSAQDVELCRTSSVGGAYDRRKDRTAAMRSEQGAIWSAFFFLLSIWLSVTPVWQGSAA